MYIISKAARIEPTMGLVYRNDWVISALIKWPVVGLKFQLQVNKSTSKLKLLLVM